MKVIWSARALGRIEAIGLYIALDSVDAAHYATVGLPGASSWSGIRRSAVASASGRTRVSRGKGSLMRTCLRSRCPGTHPPAK